jgi:serpin B
MRLFRALPVALLALSAAACQSSSPSKKTPTIKSIDDCGDPETAGCLVASDKPRITTTGASQSDIDAAVSGNSAFAVDLYQSLRGQSGNVFYSPFSISEALAMTWAGARGATADQMAKTLHFSLDQGKLHPALNAVDLALASRGAGEPGKDGQPFRLNVANALWGQLGYAFEAPFLDTLAQNYGAGMYIADFRAEPEPSRQIINAWVADRTENRIVDLLGEGSIDSNTKLVLTNAIYFNASWATPFDAAATTTDTFTKADGTALPVPTMHAEQMAGYAKGTGYELLDLPYAGNQLSMTLILPTAGTIDAFEGALTADGLQKILGGIQAYDVSISLPKFHIESSFNLSDSLVKLGMTDAFSPAADFSGISKQSQLAISAVLHKAFIDVDENGTEAAAATAVVLGDGAIPEHAEIHLDHPFLVMIRDQPTGSILFFGRVADPKG